EESPMLAKILNLGTKAIQPIQQGAISATQEAVKTGGDPEATWRAAKTGAFFGMAGEAAPAFAKSGIQKVQEPMTQAAARTASAATIAGEQQSAYEAALERQRQAAARGAAIQKQARDDATKILMDSAKGDAETQAAARAQAETKLRDAAAAAAAEHNAAYEQA